MRFARYVTGTAELRVQHRSRAIADDMKSALLLDGGQRIFWQVSVLAITPTEGPNG